MVFKCSTFSLFSHLKRTIEVLSLVHSLSIVQKEHFSSYKQVVFASPFQKLTIYKQK